MLARLKSCFYLLTYLLFCFYFVLYNASALDMSEIYYLCRFLCLVCDLPMCRSCIEEHRFMVM